MVARRHGPVQSSFPAARRARAWQWAWARWLFARRPVGRVLIASGHDHTTPVARLQGNLLTSSEFTWHTGHGPVVVRCRSLRARRLRANHRSCLDLEIRRCIHAADRGICLSSRLHHQPAGTRFLYRVQTNMTVNGSVSLRTTPVASRSSLLQGNNTVA